MVISKLVIVFLVGIGLLCSFATNGQRISSMVIMSDYGTCDRIVFYDSISGSETSVDIATHNPYLNLPLPRKDGLSKRGYYAAYDLSAMENQQVVSMFFKDNQIARDYGSLIHFRYASETVYAETFDSYAVLIYSLLFFDESAIVGNKSTIVVVDQFGRVTSNLRENDDGYFAPALTEDGKYIGLLVGDISPDAQFTLFNSPRFVIIEVSSGERVYELSGNYSFKVPVAFGKLLRIVTRENGQYTYNVIDMYNRFSYHKSFSRDEVGRFVEFRQNGILMSDGNSQEILVEFEKQFFKRSF